MIDYASVNGIVRKMNNISNNLKLIEQKNLDEEENELKFIIDFCNTLDYLLDTIESIPEIEEVWNDLSRQ